MANLTVQMPSLAGTGPLTAAAATSGGDALPAYDGKTYIRVINGGGSPINVTIPAQVACNQGVLHDAVVAVPNGSDREIGPFPSQYVDVNGAVQIHYSAVTTVTVSAHRTA